MIYYFLVPVIKTNFKFFYPQSQKKVQFCLTCINSIFTPFLDLQYRIYYINY